ncbi:nitroreductase/quinone reductase family protein [Nonomuraea longicatena]|uniref:Nitroreductase/quinone reductase family protein n=1 Tax=Nonomuraea longicatena TaxID=83682 RepID=A0ABP4BK24_9ACTN
MSNIQQQIIDEFRARKGEVGRFESSRLLLLTTTGARSGAPHTVPLGYLPDVEERVLVIASAMGADHHPAWYHNLVANPRVTVETGLFTHQADAVVLTGAERDAAFARAVESDPGWAEYQAGTSRLIPVVALHAIHDGPPGAGSFGDTLRAIHAVYRRELAVIRKELTDAGPSLVAQLRINCLAFCQGLHTHHTMEDRGLFPAVAAQHPEKAAVVERLSREHERVAALLEALTEAVTDREAGAETVRAEVERLADELEAHLDYEEEQLIPLFDA